jgi:pyruvate dehydrogenase E2 component (dihydrolipoamide acetyltransferase)
MFPVSSFDAIIYPQHSAALAVGAITPTPVADAGGVRVAPLATLTLTVDHRLINGKKAAQYLARVKEILETGAFS